MQSHRVRHDPTKQCTKCLVFKDIQEFDANLKSVDGKTSHCSKCLESVRRWRRNHPEHRQQYELAYRLKQREIPCDIWSNYAKIAQRFYAKIHYCEHGPDCIYCCHLWLGATAAGYGQFSVASRQKELTHRMAWMLHNKRDVLPGYVIAHHCDVKKCCNFSHLFHGTSQENMDDMRQKGRANLHGRGKTWEKITKSDITMIRILVHQGFSQSLLARIFHVAQGSISCIVLRKTHKYL